jgi:hypothetical protein
MLVNPKKLMRPGNGDPPVLMDDGGCTRIRQVGAQAGGTLDALLPNSGTPGTATIPSSLKAATIHSVYIDNRGETQSNKTKLSGTFDTIEVSTDSGVSVSVTVSATTTITMARGVSVHTEDDKKTKQRSYLGSDTGSITTIVTNLKGKPVTTFDASGLVLCMLHLRFI